MKILYKHVIGRKRSMSGMYVSGQNLIFAPILSP